MKKYLLFFFLLFSISACSEDDIDHTEKKPLYEDPIANEDEKTPNDELPVPSPDDEEQHITKVDFYMGQCSSSLSMQGAALFGSTLFQFVNGNSEIHVYDLEKKEYLGTIKGTTNTKWHNNQVTFSHIFYQEDDEFPLLYVSQILPSQQSIQVWRVIRTDALFDLQLVQQIQLPYDNDENNLYHFNIVIDNNDEFFWLYSRNRNTVMGQISKWALPDPHLSEVILTEGDILERFSINVIMQDAQGGYMIGQRIYFVQGVPSRTDLRMHIVNVNTQEVSTFNLRDYNFKVEPEGLCFYRGRFLCTTNRRGIYEIYFNKY